MKKKAVILLSGGLDSATIAYIAKNSGFEIITITINYGQRHDAELLASKSLIKKLSISDSIQIDLDLKKIGGSALTDDFDIPKGGIELDQKNFIPKTYVPARNLIFLSIASSVAEVKKAEAIFIGINSLDYSGYPDCRPEFIISFQETLKLGSRVGQKNPIKIKAPLSLLSKKEIILKAKELKVPIELTWSCYDPIQELNKFIPCKNCDACILRKKGFKEANVIDPVNEFGIDFNLKI